MTQLLDDAIAIVRRLSSAQQDEIANAMLGLAEAEAQGEEFPEPEAHPDSDPERRLTIAADLPEEELGERGAPQYHASDEEVEAAFRDFKV